MNGAQTSHDDEYLATVFPVRSYFGPGSHFINRIETLFDKKAHHLLRNKKNLAVICQNI